jgi:hypothetical protein
MFNKLGSIYTTIINSPILQFDGIPNLILNVIHFWETGRTNFNWMDQNWAEFSVLEGLARLS